MVSSVIPTQNNYSIERSRMSLELDRLLHRMCAAPPGCPERERLREQIILTALPLARRLVHRYRMHGEPLEDLSQVAAVGLVQAVDRYDPTYGQTFIGYAISTILGEVKRHFRDRTWSVHVPRRLRDLRRELATALEVLPQRLRRSPTMPELAGYLGVDADELVEVMYAAQSYDALSLDGPGVRAEILGDEVGERDRAFEHVDAATTVYPALRHLPARDQKIIYLRFFENMSQTQIAAQVGISQMHVSRLIHKSLERMRGYLNADDDARGG